MFNTPLYSRHFNWNNTCKSIKSLNHCVVSSDIVSILHMAGETRHWPSSKIVDSWFTIIDAKSIFHRRWICETAGEWSIGHEEPIDYATVDTVRIFINNECERIITIVSLVVTQWASSLLLAVKPAVYMYGSASIVVPLCVSSSNETILDLTYDKKELTHNLFCDIES